MQDIEFNIAVLLPTRGRTTSLSNSVETLLKNVHNIDDVCLVLGFDNDDEIGLNHFSSQIQPLLDEMGANYRAITFNRMGYAALNRYYNELGKQVKADWYFVWNDDAVMNSKDWDTEIINETGNFAILKVHTHNEHPYSIFPIVPNEWFNELGALSKHQMIDAELSQMAYMLDVIKIVNIDVTHDQSELTGEIDSTSLEKRRFEGNPLSPVDFHHNSFNQQRINDCIHLAKFMKSKGMSTTFFDNVLVGAQDPWEKLKLNDVNKQMFQFSRAQLDEKLIGLRA